MGGGCPGGFLAAGLGGRKEGRKEGRKDWRDGMAVWVCYCVGAWEGVERLLGTDFGYFFLFLRPFCGFGSLLNGIYLLLWKL